MESGLLVGQRVCLVRHISRKIPTAKNPRKWPNLDCGAAPTGLRYGRRETPPAPMPAQRSLPRAAEALWPTIRLCK